MGWLNASAAELPTLRLPMMFRRRVLETLRPRLLEISARGSWPINFRSRFLDNRRIGGSAADALNQYSIRQTVLRSPKQKTPPDHWWGFSYN
ncbi:hypothetical protein, partial [Massilia sp.]|uniref:hypothetical protein n=1 Tax=Massilia sp. TaxID=1882437 RepID=UPI00289E7F1A